MNCLASMSVALVPIVAVFGASIICPMDKNTPRAWFQPDSRIFAPAWTILTLLLGSSLYLSISEKSTQAAYTLLLLTMLLAAWPCLYRRSRRYALYLIYMQLATTLAALLLAKSVLLRVSLVPLLVWLLFAASLSASSTNLLVLQLRHI